MSEQRVHRVESQTDGLLDDVADLRVDVARLTTSIEAERHTAILAALASVREAGAAATEAAVQRVVAGVMEARETSRAAESEQLTRRISIIAGVVGTLLTLLGGIYGLAREPADPPKGAGSQSAQEAGP